MSDMIPAVSPGIVGSDLSARPVKGIEEKAEKKAEKKEVSEVREFNQTDLAQAVQSVENAIAMATDIALSFSIDEDLSRLVVAVKSVGSDKIIRQFPPEEFLTVAKHIASQNPDTLDEDFLKGVLFDQFT